MQQAQRIASLSIAVGIAVLGLKGAGWWLTGSAGLYSDALESTVNVASALIALIALRLALQPADANHPYGHDKAEFFAAVIAGSMIVVAAISILEHAWDAWRNPEPLTRPALGLGFNLAATAINAAWGLVLARAGRKYRSAALAADAKHLFADVVTSLAILAGVSLAFLTRISMLDPIAAALAACYILWSGTSVILASAGGLMDAAPPEDVIARVRRVVAANADGAIEAHDLRMRQSGRQSFLEFHLVVPGALAVSEAHAICDRVETALKAEIEDLRISIHVEPEAKAKHQGILVL